jgi:hypothetical protein
MSSSVYRNCKECNARLRKDATGKLCDKCIQKARSRPRHDDKGRHHHDDHKEDKLFFTEESAVKLKTVLNEASHLLALNYNGLYSIPIPDASASSSKDASSSSKDVKSLTVPTIVIPWTSSGTDIPVSVPLASVAKTVTGSTPAIVTNPFSSKIDHYGVSGSGTTALLQAPRSGYHDLTLDFSAANASVLTAPPTSRAASPYALLKIFRIFRNSAVVYEDYETADSYFGLPTLNFKDTRTVYLEEGDQWGYAFNTTGTPSDTSGWVVTKFAQTADFRGK